jgi:hypothetical protein
MDTINRIWRRRNQPGQKKRRRKGTDGMGRGCETQNCEGAEKALFTANRDM